MNPFTYAAPPSRVIFGAGALAQVPEAVASLGARRALVIATRSQRQVADGVLAALGEAGAGLFDDAAMHTPIEVTERAMAMARETGADCAVAIGGGSAIGLGKALALRTDMPQVVVPTTYAGSEMTDVVGQTEKGIKTTQGSPKIQPEVVIYDPVLTLSLPVSVSVASGFNAMAHAVEGLYARQANPLLSLVSEEGVRAMAAALPRIAATPGDLEARTEAMSGGWLCGWALAGGISALHHKLCHVLGGAFALPHAELHTVLLPHALAYNIPAVPEAVARLRRALGVTGDPAAALQSLALSLGAPTALRDIGMPADGIDRALELAFQAPYWNPRPLKVEAVRGLLERAWAGETPRA